MVKLENNLVLIRSFFTKPMYEVIPILSKPEVVLISCGELFAEVLTFKAQMLRSDWWNENGAQRERMAVWSDLEGPRRVRRVTSSKEEEVRTAPPRGGKWWTCISTIRAQVEMALVNNWTCNILGGRIFTSFVRGLRSYALLLERVLNKNKKENENVLLWITYSNKLIKIGNSHYLLQHNVLHILRLLMNLSQMLKKSFSAEWFNSGNTM